MSSPPNTVISCDFTDGNRKHAGARLGTRVKKKQHVEAGGREVAISNADKIYFPGNGFSKGEVLSYYAKIADFILPHLRERPLTLKRFPEGVSGNFFYEKNAPSHTPDWVKIFPVERTEGEGTIRYILCNDEATLLWATNLGDIEKHVLLGKAPKLQFPTSVVFDLDPGAPAGILEAGAVALHLKEIFDALGLACFVKVSGSKGLHLSVPLNTPTSYEVSQPFAKAVAELAAKQLPDKVTSTMAKKLRTGKVLIDWSQNSESKTTVCVYAMRANRPEPFVSLPVTWQELARAVKRGDENALQFPPDAALRRVKRLGDLFEPVLQLKQKLPASFLDAVAAAPPAKLSSWPRKSSRMRDKSLREYAAKRDPKATPEPQAGKPEREKRGETSAGRFVIQKHDASHLHYDWRLEMEGVLRSWAVPKGPPRRPKEARLAMHVEDHPLDYADFEGTIPEGNYGAGTVMVWDQGEYEDLSGNPAAAFHQGKMHLQMRGKKLKGEWVLIKDRREEDSEKWLLIKAGEALPLSAKADDTSAISGRSMAQIAKAKDRQWQSNRSKNGAKKATEPKFIPPMQCKPVKALPEGDAWHYELKLDGYRCLALKSGTQTRLFSRTGKRLDARFERILDAVRKIEGDFLIDGEVVAVDEDGRPSFQRLQDQGANGSALLFYAFDLLNREGEDICRKPLEERREALANLLRDVADPIRLTAQIEGSPEEILSAVRKLGLEGMIGKRAGSRYEAGERSGAWIKLRLDRAQEFVIGGYVPGGRTFDSLLIGLYKEGRLEYVGKVRNGFVPRTREEVFADLKKNKSERMPFVNLPEKRSSQWRAKPLDKERLKECRWVKPKLVCQVGFAEWTEGDRLRHCSFIALRDDKKAADVVRET